MLRKTIFTILIATSLTQQSNAQSPEQLYQSFFQGVAIDNRCSFLKFAERSGIPGMTLHLQDGLPETQNYKSGTLSPEAYQTYLEKLRSIARDNVRSIECTDLQTIGQYILPTREWLALENFSDVFLAFQSPELSDELKQAGLIFEGFLKQLYGENFEPFAARAQQFAATKFQQAMAQDAASAPSPILSDEDWAIVYEAWGFDEMPAAEPPEIPTYTRDGLIDASVEILRSILFELKFDQAGLAYAIYTHKRNFLDVLIDKEGKDRKAKFNIIGPVSQVMTQDRKQVNMSTLLSDTGDLYFNSWGEEADFLSERSVTVYAPPLDLSDEERQNVMFQHQQEWLKRARPIHLQPAQSGCVTGPCFVLTRAQIEAAADGTELPDFVFIINETADQPQPDKVSHARYSLSGSSIATWYDYLSAQ